MASLISVHQCCTPCKAAGRKTVQVGGLRDQEGGRRVAVAWIVLAEEDDAIMLKLDL
jgi:hypothetical protein